jgi:hypothetical protein
MTRAKREAPPPTKWGKSSGGTYFEIVYTRKRNLEGKKLYRLLYLYSGVKGNTTWTLDELNEQKVRWLKNRPSKKHVG